MNTKIQPILTKNFAKSGVFLCILSGIAVAICLSNKAKSSQQLRNTKEKAKKLFKVDFYKRLD
jgi:hypothetical protein